MAQTSAGIGHNQEPLSDDDRAALVAYFGMNIRNKRAIAEAKKAEAKAASAEVNKLFATVKGQLGFIRYKFEELLDAQDMDEDEFLRAEAERQALFKLGGLDVEVGTQFDLVDRIADTADDQARAYAQGKLAGLKGEEGTPPETLSPVMIQDWMAGWNDGQTDLIMKLGRAKDILDAQALAKAAQNPPDDEDEDDTEADDEFDADEAARKLKREGFMERGGDEEAEAA